MAQSQRRRRHRRKEAVDRHEEQDEAEERADGTAVREGDRPNRPTTLIASSKRSWLQTILRRRRKQMSTETLKCRDSPLPTSVTHVCHLKKGSCSNFLYAGLSTTEAAATRLSVLMSSMRASMDA